MLRICKILASALSHTPVANNTGIALIIYMQLI